MSSDKESKAGPAGRSLVSFVKLREGLRRLRQGRRPCGRHLRVNRGVVREPRALPASRPPIWPCVVTSAPSDTNTSAERAP